MKDKRNHHGTIGKSPSEQHFRKSAAFNFNVWNFWTLTPSAIGFYGSWLADKIQANFKNFKVSSAVDRNIQLIASFNQGTASLQPYQCIAGGFSGKRPLQN